MTMYWRANDSIPPVSNQSVAEVMKERGVGRRRAYEIIRRETADNIDTDSVGQGQRVAVMACLIAHPETGRNSGLIMEVLHENGVKIDIHDVNKTLWALAKTNFIRMRKRNNPRSLYAISMTPEGIAAYENMTRRNGRSEEARQVTAQAIQQEVNAPGAGKPFTDEEIDEIVEDLHLGHLNPYPWPNGMGDAFRAVRERALRAAKINAAAKLLEEAGEYDIALNLMSKTDFTPLEQEVIDILRIYGEINE